MELNILEHSEFGEVRTTTDEKGNILFCATEVAKALGYKDATNAIKRHCRKDGVAFRHPIDTMGRVQETKFITEGNVYRLIIKSKLPSAIAFETWLFDEMLPTLRHYGIYASNEVLSDPDLLDAMVKQLKEEQEVKVALTLENERLSENIADTKPQLDYLQTILNSDCTMTSTQIAADYGISACRLNKVLHTEKIHRKVGGQWVLYINYMEQGLTHSETVPINASNRAFVVQTKWTQKGRLLIHEVLTRLGYVAYYHAKVRLYQLNNRK